MFTLWERSNAVNKEVKFTVINKRLLCWCLQTGIYEYDMGLVLVRNIIVTTEIHMQPNAYLEQQIRGGARKFSALSKNRKKF